MKDMNELANDLLNVARVLLIVIGAAVGLIKIVKGKTDENPRDFFEGLAVIAIAAVLEAASFAVEYILR